ncbi:MAG: penicillin acylase family protein [Thermoprotei archaeon]
MNYKRLMNFIATVFVIFVITSLIFLEPINLIMSLLSISNGIWNSASSVSGNKFILQGLHSGVKIIIDNRSVPHIYASDDYDLFYAIGFIHARDRLWQMDIQRRAAEGRLAEVVGKDAINNDMLMRIIGLWRAANITASSIKNEYPSYYKLYQAYADGVNAYIQLAKKSGKLPLMFRLLNYEPDPWTPTDSIAFAKLMAWSLTNYFEPLKYSLIVTKIGAKETLKLYPIYPYYEENVTVVPGNGTINGKKINVQPDYLLNLNWYSQWATGLNFNDTTFKDKLIEAIDSILALTGDPYTNQSQGIQSYENNLYNMLAYSMGSNDWAVAPSKSENGLAMLADDPHLQLQLPSLWYEVDLHSPDINAYGVTLVGIPAIIIGFNNKIAWGLTNTQISVLDFYVEKTNPSNPDEYWYNGSWHAFKVIKEIINVKDSPSITLLINETIHGPVLTKRGLTISAKWIGMKTTYEAIAIVDVMKAQNVTQFFNALRLWDVPSQNFMYVDVYGTIAVIEPGKFPFRIIKLPNGDIVKVVGSRSVLNGTGDYEWAGYIPFNDLPNSINPQQGYLAAPNQMSIGRYYPYFILGGWWDPGARAQTINMILGKPGLLTLNDMIKAQSSVHDWYAQMFVPLILKSVEKYPSNDPGVQRAVYLLKNWNYSMLKDLEAPSVWWFWLSSFYNITFITKYRELGIKINQYPYPGTILYLAFNEPNSRWFDGDFYKKASQALINAVEELKSKLGENWTWGKYHVLYLEHISQLKPLSIGPLPEDGDPFTLMAAPFSSIFYGPVKHGPSWRMIVIMNKTGPVAYGVYPGGQSENPISNHYNDFVNKWLTYKYNKLLLENNPQEIPTKIVKEVITLLPLGSTSILFGDDME